MSAFVVGVSGVNAYVLTLVLLIYQGIFNILRGHSSRVTTVGTLILEGPRNCYVLVHWKG
jgi:hypothetical protein